MERKETNRILENSTKSLFIEGRKLYRLIHRTPLQEADFLYKDPTVQEMVYSTARVEGVREKTRIRAYIHETGKDILMDEVLNMLYIINRSKQTESQDQGYVFSDIPLIVDQAGFNLVEPLTVGIGKILEIDYMTGHITSGTRMIKFQESEYNKYFPVKNAGFEIIKVAGKSK